VTGRGIRPSPREFFSAGTAGLLFALAFPPLPLAGLAFVCLAPLAAAIGRAADTGQPTGVSGRLGVWFAVVGFGLSLYWIGVALSLFTPLAWLAYVATVIVMAILTAGTTAALHVARRLTRWPLAVLLPATWVSFEILLVYFSDLAFPWFPLGLSVAGHPLLAQAADVSGVHGLSVWIAATNGLFADGWLAWERRREQPVAGVVATVGRAFGARLMVILALAAAISGYGAWRMRTIPVRPLAHVGVVQPDVSEDEKMQRQMDRFIQPLAALTRQEERAAAPGHAPELVLWPETALPDFLVNHPEWSDSLRSLARDGHAPILFGMIDYTITGTGSRDYDYFNAATVVDTNGLIGREPAYHKRYLVPIVERVPFLNPKWFSGLQYFGGFGRGATAVPFTFGFGGVGVLICYESIFPQQSRRYRRGGADLIVNITNDAWFGHSLAPYQHEAHLRLRAIENRVGVVRAANTGISEYIDPFGRPHGATDLFVPAALTYDVQTTDVRPLAVVWGDWVGSLCVAITVGLLLVNFARMVRGAKG
jgi:apolipoprotein N-acyltransferase